MKKLILVSVEGMPGTGKSTVAVALSRVLGWPTIDKDTLKSTLLAAGFADANVNVLAYELMCALAREMLVEQQLSVILDSPDPPLHVLQAIAYEAGDTLKIILCLAERDLRNQRIAERKGKLSQPGGMSQTAGDGREYYAHLPTGTLLLSTTQPPSELLKPILAYLQVTPRETEQE